jgi:hypothetical protein
MRRAVLGAASLLVLSSCGTDRQWQRLEERWVERSGYQPLERHPPREANAAARRLEEILAPYGYGFAPTDSPGRPEIAPEAVERKGEIDSSIIELLRSDPKGASGEFPEEIAHWLIEVEPALVEVRTLLGSEEPPRWELRLDHGYEMELPNLIGQLQLHRLLVAAALRLADSDRSECEGWLEAASRLNLALAEDPLVLSQTVAMAEVQTMQRGLRRLDFAPGHWRRYLPVESLRNRTYEALRIENWKFIHSARTGRLGPPGSKPENPGFFEYHGARGVMAATDRAIDRLRGSDLRTHDHDRFYREIAGGVPRWNVIARILLPNLLDVPVKAARSELDLELTRWALEIRERLQSGAVGSTDLEGVRESTAAPGILWRSSVESGSVWIRAVGGEIPTQSRYPLPLEHRIPIPSLE